jgi:phosphoribosylpyrophosphate synthetase
MRNEKSVTQATTEISPDQKKRARNITIAEARRMAFAASEKIRQAQISYAEEEAKRSYDYRVEE